MVQHLMLENQDECMRLPKSIKQVSEQNDVHTLC